MKSFYKYIICFLLGIIIFYLLFKENNIEGNVFEIDIGDLNRGCSNYTCKNDPSTYDNYQKKTDPGTQSAYTNCLPISEQEIYHTRGTGEDHQPSDGPVNLCTNEICCENFICSENEDIVAPQCLDLGQMFLPNNKCSVGADIQSTCNMNICCSSNPVSNAGELEGLFDEIIVFRNNHGGKNNGQYITGEDILFYLYYSFLDIKQMSEVLVPLDIDGEKFPNIVDLATLRSNINTILTGVDVGDNEITETYSDNDYKGKPVFFNDDVELVLEFDNANDNDNCSYDISTKTKYVNNKEDYFPQDCIGYNNKILRYAFYKNISSYDKNVSLRLKGIPNTLTTMADFVQQGDLNFTVVMGSGLFEAKVVDAQCQDIDINYPMNNAVHSTQHGVGGFVFTITDKIITTDNERYYILNPERYYILNPDSPSPSYTIKALQKIKYAGQPNENSVLEIYDTYKVLKSKEDMNYIEFRFLNEWLNTISLDDDAEIDRKIILNKVLTLETDITAIIPPDTDIMINGGNYKTSIKTNTGNKMVISGLPDETSNSSITYGGVTINITSVDYGDINTIFSDIITESSEELNLKKFILNLDKSTSYHNLKPLDKLFHTYLGSNKNTLISKKMFVGLNE